MRILVSNLLGVSKAGPIIAKGWSAEAPPTLAPQRLRTSHVEASTIELIWDWPTTTTGRVNGFFVGLRIEWCLAEKESLCDRYKTTEV